MTPKEIMQKAINTYGTEAQVDMAIEEMSELSKALLKMRRAVKSSNNYAYIKTKKCDIIEEIADVEIMLQQLRIIYEIGEQEIATQKDYKIRRLKERFGG